MFGFGATRVDFIGGPLCGSFTTRAEIVWRSPVGLVMERRAEAKFFGETLRGQPHHVYMRRDRGFVHDGVEDLR